MLEEIKAEKKFFLKEQVAAALVIVYLCCLAPTPWPSAPELPLAKQESEVASVPAPEHPRWINAGVAERP